MATTRAPYQTTDIIDQDALQDSKKVINIILLVLIVGANVGFLVCIVLKRKSLTAVKFGLLFSFVCTDLFLALACLTAFTLDAFDVAIKENACYFYFICTLYAFFYILFGYSTGLILLALEIFLRRNIVSNSSEQGRVCLSVFVSVLPWALGFAIVVCLTFVGADPDDYLDGCNRSAVSTDRKRALEFATSLIPTCLAVLVAAVAVLYGLNSTTPSEQNSDEATLRPHWSEANSTAPASMSRGTSAYSAHKDEEEISQLEDDDKKQEEIISPDDVGAVKVSKGDDANADDIEGGPESMYASTTLTYPDDSLPSAISPDPTGNGTSAGLQSSVAPLPSPYIPSSMRFSPTWSPTASSLSGSFSFPTAPAPYQYTTQLSAMEPSMTKVSMALAKDSLVLLFISLASFMFIIPYSIFRLVYLYEGQEHFHRVAFVSLDYGLMWWSFLRAVLCPIMWIIGLTL